MSFLQLVDKICDLTEAMIDKTLIAFYLCSHKDYAVYTNTSEKLLEC